MALMLGWMGGVCADDASYSEQLAALEKIRKTDVHAFKNSLMQLAPARDSMDAENQCFYDYLSIYSASYGGEYAKSKVDIKELLERCEQFDHVVIRAKSLLTSFHIIAGEFRSAIIILNEVVSQVEEVEDRYLRSQLLHLASRSYRLMNQDALGIKYADLLINANGSKENVCFGEFNKYRILMRQGKVAEFAGSIDSAIANCRSTHNLIAALFLELDSIRYSLVSSPNQLALAEAAIPKLLQLKNDVDKTELKNLEVYYQALLGNVYWHAEQPEAAARWALIALEENTTIGESEQLIMALDVLINASLAQGDMQNAYQHLKSKSNIQNTIYERKMATQVAYYRVLHENLAQELEIEQLNQNNELLRLENQLAAETTKRQQLMMLLIASLLLLLGVWAYKIKKRHDYFKEVAEIDHLTQVFTRKAFEEKVRVMLEQAAERNEPVNLAIMDLDHFKNVNDQYGHLVGDWVLKQVVLTCEEVADEDILVARLGGEEFCMVSPGISQLEMMRLMEKMRAAIEAMDSSDSGAIFDITASFGVTTTALSGYRVSMLLTHADLALFEAKNKGRNEVVAYDEIMQDVLSVKA